jgi:hypothetical protein
MDWSWQGFLILVEQSGISVWMRESPSMLSFPTVIALHAVGMGLVAGANAAMDFRILGFGRGIPISSLERFVPVMRFGFWLNAVSGIMLLLAYPTKALTNPVFYLKILCIALALTDTLVIRKQVIHKSALEQSAVTKKAKILAVVSILLWAGAIVSGRLLAYTYIYLDSSFDSNGGL